MSFTPGPWEYGVRRDGSIWLSIGHIEQGPHYQGDLVASQADAALIVAAKDLYEALEACVGVMYSAKESVGGYQALAKAGAALSKARGEKTQ